MRKIMNAATAAVACVALGLTACATRTDTRPDVIVTSESDAPYSTPVVPSGTVLNVQLDQKLSVEDSERGDAFTATLTEPVIYNGEVVVPAGSKVKGHITGVQDADDVESDVDVLKLHFTRLNVHGQDYPLNARLTDAAPRMEKDTDAGETIAGAVGGGVVGALIGAIIGDGDEKAVLIGGAIGAAAGTAIVLGTADDKAVLPENSPMRLLTESRIVLASD